MIKTLLSAILLGALTSAQPINPKPDCKVCWDGSQAIFESNACVCPAASPSEPTPAEEEPLDSNHNCMTGHSQACNRNNGVFDFVSCSCASPPNNAQDDWTPPEGFIDENDEEWNEYGDE